MHKILKIVAAVLGLAGIIFLIRIISRGDQAIKAAALSGDTAIVDPMAYVAYIILGLVIAFVLYFVIKNLFSNTGSLKNTLISIGAFAVVLIIAYVISGGDTTPYFYNGLQATEGQSHMVGAGLVAFYLLMLTAAGLMIITGAKKIINTK